MKAQPRFLRRSGKVKSKVLLMPPASTSACTHGSQPLKNASTSQSGTGGGWGGSARAIPASISSATKAAARTARLARGLIAPPSPVPRSPLQLGLDALPERLLRSRLALLDQHRHVALEVDLACCRHVLLAVV